MIHMQHSSDYSFYSPKFVSNFDLLQIFIPHFSQCAFEVENKGSKQSEVSESSQSEMEMSDIASDTRKNR